MAFGRTFGQVVDSLALQLGRNVAPSAVQGYRDQLKELVRRAYEELLDEYEWPHLSGHFEKLTQAGQRYYDFPEFTQFGKFYSPYAFYTGNPDPLTRGISIADYGAYDPDTDRCDPVMKWDLRATAAGTFQVEFWPVPASDDIRILFSGQRAPVDIVDDADVLVLDDHLVNLWVLYEKAEAEGRKNAKALQQKALRRLTLVKAKLAPASDFNLSGKDVQFRRAPTEIRVVRSA
jgi:hypothetical protein